MAVVLYRLIPYPGQNACIIGKISLKLVKYILLSILHHSYMLCDQLQCTVCSFAACISQFVAWPQTCLTWYVHIIKGNILYMCTSSQRPLTIWCPCNTTTCFLARHLIFSLMKIWSPWHQKCDEHCFWLWVLQNGSRIVEAILEWIEHVWRGIMSRRQYRRCANGMCMIVDHLTDILWINMHE